MKPGDKVVIRALRLSKDEKEDGDIFYEMELPTGLRISAMEEQYFDGVIGELEQILQLAVLPENPPVYYVRVPVTLILLCREWEVQLVEPTKGQAGSRRDTSAS